MIWSILPAQISFESKTLASIYRKLPKESQHSFLSSAVVNCQINGTAVKVIAQFGKLNKISHLGLEIFKDNIKSIIPGELSLFLERTFLEDLLINDMQIINDFNRQNRIIMSLDGGAAGNLMFQKFTNVMPVLSDLSTCNVKRDSLKYQITLANSTGREFVINFPVNNNLIRGMDKKELDDLTRLEIKGFRATAQPTMQVDSSEVKQQKAGIYMYPGKSYYNLLFSDIYFVKDGSGFQYLISKSSYIETFTNILLRSWDLGSAKSVNVTQRMYGSNQDHYRLILKDFMGYFVDNGFELYFGIEDSSKNNLTATVVAYNRSLNFINLLAIKTTHEELFKANGQFDITLFTNIPTDNIKNLFGTYADDERRKKYLIEGDLK